VRDDLPTGTVTFLFTDVEGSTKLLHELGSEAYAEALAERRRVVRRALARHWETEALLSGHPGPDRRGLRGERAAAFGGGTLARAPRPAKQPARGWGIRTAEGAS